MQSTNTNNQILLGPQTGLQEVFSSSGMISGTQAKKETNNNGATSTNKSNSTV